MSKICVVVPCYNEYERLNVKAFSDFISENKDHCYFLFVNDGSTDDTLIVLDKLVVENPGHCLVLNLTQNSGKAEAVRQGLLKAYEMKKFQYLAYFDADLATPLTEIKALDDIITLNPQLVMVLCSRIKRLGAKIERKLKRHILGRIFSTIASNILGLPVYDTQCGAKLIKANIVPQIFNEPFITSWLFDVEIIARLRNANKNSITSLLYEHPVSKWEDVGGSKLKFKHMIKVPLELLKIHHKYN